MFYLKSFFIDLLWHGYSLGKDDKAPYDNQSISLTKLEKIGKYTKCVYAAPRSSLKATPPLFRVKFMNQPSSPPVPHIKENTEPW